jgi:hypothetical protein
MGDEIIHRRVVEVERVVKAGAEDSNRGHRY